MNTRKVYEILFCMPLIIITSPNTMGGWIVAESCVLFLFNKPLNRTSFPAKKQNGTTADDREN